MAASCSVITIMLPKYEDILALAERAGAGGPLWFDESGVPRFAKFHPDLLGVYDRYAVLAEATCASCGKDMLVALGRPKIEIGPCGTLVPYDLAGVIGLVEAWHDPPRHDLPDGGRCAGETMSCGRVRVVQAWEQGDDFEWRRSAAGLKMPDTWPAPPASCQSRSAEAKERAPVTENLSTNVDNG